MGLKQSIVVVNQFSVPRKNGGTKGSTPGSYVIRYMAREDASEHIAPVKKDDLDAFVTQYMLRHSAMDDLEHLNNAYSRLEKPSGLGGLAFGRASKHSNVDISLSDKKVREISKQIQTAFDQGHTVLETVISFDEEYLKQHGIVDPDFECEKRGDYRGQIDQLKLRVAISEGMRYLSRGFGDLSWVAVIQVDTEHVHAHLAMVDLDKTVRRKDGEQRGKLKSSEIAALRRGIELSLNELAPLKTFSKTAAYERTNVSIFVKRFVHEYLHEGMSLQLLSAILPADKTMWRAASNAREMQRPNEVCAEIVQTLFEAPDSHYSQALEQVKAYASERVRLDQRSQDYELYIEQGKKDIQQRCMNTVYEVLAGAKDRLVKPTPVMEAFRLDLDELETFSDRELGDFAFKLRSFSARRKHHEESRRKYHTLLEDFKTQQLQGSVDPMMAPLQDFYEEEEEYHAKLGAKYRYLVGFLDKPEDDLDSLIKDFTNQEKRVKKMELMLSDRALHRRKPQSAKQYAKRVYDRDDGDLAITAPEFMQDRLERMRLNLEKSRANLRVILFERGKTFDEDGNLQNQDEYDFEDVKYLDIHDLSYDFPRNAPISIRYAQEFAQVAKRRQDLAQVAYELLASQGGVKLAESVVDIGEIQRMLRMARRIGDDQLLPHIPAKDVKHIERSNPIRVDDKTLQEALKDDVKSLLQRYPEV